MTTLKKNLIYLRYDMIDEIMNKYLNEWEELDVDASGKLTAKGEQQMAKYRKEKEKREVQKIINKHSSYEKKYRLGIGTSTQILTTDWKAVDKELKQKGLKR